MPWFISRKRVRKTLLSADSEKEVWFHLSEHKSEYQVRANLQRYYREVEVSADASEVEEAARYFVHCLKQAQEYFEASKSVSILTRPLLLFYGMVCLAKMLIILKVPSYPRIIATQKAEQQHGLGYTSNIEPNVLLEKDVVKIQPNGTFSSLAKYFNQDLPYQTEYSIAELYGWIPDLLPYLGHVRHHLASVNTHILHEGNSIVAKIEIRNAKHMEEGKLLERYAYLTEDFEQISPDVFFGKTERTKKTFPRELEGEALKERVDTLVNELETYLTGISNYDYSTREYLLPPKAVRTLNPLMSMYITTYAVA